jgi:hypothetical protein
VHEEGREVVSSQIKIIVPEEKRRNRNRNFIFVVADDVVRD